DAAMAATGPARGAHTAIALATGAKPRADAAGVCRAGTSQRFRDTSAEVADNRTLIKDPGGQALPLRERLGFCSHQAVGGVQDDDLFLLPGRQRQRIDHITQGVSIGLELGLVVENMPGSHSYGLIQRHVLFVVLPCHQVVQVHALAQAFLCARNQLVACLHPEQLSRVQVSLQIIRESDDMTYGVGTLHRQRRSACARKCSSGARTSLSRFRDNTIEKLGTPGAVGFAYAPSPELKEKRRCQRRAPGIYYRLPNGSFQCVPT